MKLLITGGGGFLGARLARTLLARDPRPARPITQIVLTDHVAPPRRPARRRARRGPHRAAARAMRRAARGTVRRHLPSRLGGLGRMRGRLRSRPALQPRQHARAARCAARHGGRRRAAAGWCSRARSRCSGRTRRVPLPAVVADDTPAGAADLLRHAEAGLRAPGRRLHAQGLHRRPRRAADDGHRAAGPAERRGLVVLLRHHPRAARGRRVDLPGAPEVSHPVSSPARTVDGLDRGLRGDARGLRRPPRAQPAGAQRARQRDARRAREGRRPGGARARALRARRAHRRHRRQLADGRVRRTRAARLGLHPHTGFAEIIRQYIDDCAAQPNADQTLKGLPQ